MPKVRRYHLERTPLQRSAEHRASSCTGKVRYRKMGAAKQALIKFVREENITELMSIYACWFCGGFHIGRSTKTILARVRVVARAE